MLRISVVNDPQATRFKLEGKLAHEWVGEAQKTWATLSARNGRKRVMVDLLEVSFIDESGLQLLLEMHRAGAKLLGYGPMISALIEEIELQDSKAAKGLNGD